MNLENRYDFVFVFDVKDGNPNGDPDAGNLPRVDAETGCGLVTDVCLKRKVRNFVLLDKEGVNGYDIYVKEKAILNQIHEDAHMAINNENKKKGNVSKDPVSDARKWMCKNFYDVRTFGAVMSTGAKTKQCGQVRGPVQLTFSRSADPIIAQEHSITRMAVTKAKSQSGDNGTMGRKYTVPYGLYIAHGFVSAHLAQQTGFGESDLELFFRALANMFEHDRSAAKGEMITRGLYVFKHDSKLGNAPAHSLFERVQIALKDTSKPPRNFSDYAIEVNDADLPQNVVLDSRFCIPEIGG